ncbi:MAG: hypothetical protein ACLGIJ_06920 [Candidatus Limnocylindria bacterium]
MARPRSTPDDDPRDREVLRPGAPLGRPAMPGPTGPAETTEAVGDPDAHSRRSAAEGGTAAGAVVGGMVAGPIGVALGAALGAAAGAASGPAEGVPVDERIVDARADREAAYRPSLVGSPRRGAHAPSGVAGRPADPRLEEHATEVPVVDLIPSPETRPPSGEPRD